jgi:integrase
MASVDLSKVSARERLKTRREPYWQQLGTGRWLGYRRMTQGSCGSWIARAIDTTGARQQRAIGQFEALPPSERYRAAIEVASSFFEGLGRGLKVKPHTVADACERYITYQREINGDKAAKDAEQRFKAYVFPHQIARIEVAKLVPGHMQDWRKALMSRPTKSGANRGGTRSVSSLNRDMTCLRAALNLALKDGFIASDFAWRSALTPVAAADKRREIYLDPTQRGLLINAASQDLATLIRGSSQLPIRPGALSKLTVADFDQRLSTLRISNDKTGRTRTLSLPASTVRFLADLCRDKLPGAPIFSRNNGKPWNKDAWKHPFKQAAALAHLPSDATLYCLRHSVITDMISDGLDTLTVAQLADTSLLMIDRHYGHLLKHKAVLAIDKLAQRVL